MKTAKLLLKTLLLSTSQINIYRHTTDKKTKKKITGRLIGLFFIYVMIMGYSIALSIGYGAFGLTESLPAMSAFMVSILAFMFTVFKTNGYLFGFREYDMLMSLPLDTATVAACKFLYMYVNSSPWYLSVSLAMMIGYGIFVRPAFYVYIIWIVLSLFLPLIPMLAAAFLGFLIARVSTGFRKANIVQTVLTFIFVIFCFSLRYIIDYMFRNDKVEDTLQGISAATDRAGGIYLPIRWFEAAVLRCSALDILLLVGVSALLFGVVFMVVGRSYRNINSAIRSHAASRKYKMTPQKKRSVEKAVAFKEFKRLTGSTTYMVNGAMGMLMAVIFGAVTLIFGFNRIVSVVTADAPFDAAILQPAIPFIIYFFVGMVSTPAISPSLEGKNYWIVQSLPIEKKALYKGKMIFNMYLMVPFMIFGILCLSISAGAPFLSTVLYLILGVVLCCFSTAWGCVCGIKHMRLDWENEVEVVKQGTAVAVYLFPNMFITMGLVVLVVFLGLNMDQNLIMIAMILITAVLATVSYLRALALAQKSF